MPQDEPNPSSSDPASPSSADESAMSPAERRAQEKAAREAELQKAVGHVVAGRYRITALLGTGGMGAVYEAEHLGIGRKVALKFVDSEWLRQGLVASRFAREARAASAIESEHIVSVFDAGTDGDRPFLVMELLRGEDLGKRLRRSGKIPCDEALDLLAQTLRGLADAHEAGIVHRDLKPDNVFLVTRGGPSRDADPQRASDPARDGDPRGPLGASTLVKIVDFGVSKIERLGSGTAPLALTQKGMVLGTPLYMAPEQAQAFEDVDARADLFSAGAILFECLAGRPPHVGATYEQIIVSICMNDSPDIRELDPSLPTSVARFLKRALARDRAKRFSSARQMLVALNEVRASLREGSAALPPSHAAPAKPLAAATMVSAGVSPQDRHSPAGATPGRQAPSTDVSWSSGSRPLAELPSRPPDRRTLSTRRLVIVGVLATVAGGVATVALVTALRPQREQARVDAPALTARLATPGEASTVLVPPPLASAGLAPSVSSPQALVAAPSAPSATTARPAAASAAARTTAPARADAGAHAVAPPAARPSRPTKPGASKAHTGELELQRDFP